MTTPVTGVPLVLLQFGALLKKNLLLSWRNKRATLQQLLSPLVFIFLIFAIDKAIKAQTSTSSAYKTVTDPPAQPSPPITPCEDKFFIKLPCYDFVWSGDQNPVFQTIVTRIMSNNPGRPIPSSKVTLFLFAIFNVLDNLAIEFSRITGNCVQVKSFKDKTEVDAWLFSNPMRCPGALHFSQPNATVLSYGLQTNSTSLQKRGKYEDSTMLYQLPLQLAAEREIARYLIGGIRTVIQSCFFFFFGDIVRFN